MKIKVNDEVQVITGQDKGKTGKVIATLRKTNQVVVEGVNVHKKHQKPNNQNQNGGIFDKEAPINVSNVKKVTSKKESKEVTTKSVKPAKKVVKKAAKKKAE
jgi:large subunit ribosomal protein L24